VCGLEIVADAAEYARQKGLKVFDEEFLAINLPNNTFDVITMWDVLEHMPDPSSVIEKCHRILKPGGLLVIKAPDPSGGEAGIFKENWVGYEAPQHLFGFPKHVLLEKSRNIGFEVIDLKQTGSDYATFFLSTAYWMKEHHLKMAGDLLIKFIRTFLGRGFAGIVIRPLRLFGLKSSCTYYLRKI
jgi:SAM-dependent methyltransferase